MLQDSQLFQTHSTIHLNTIFANPMNLLTLIIVHVFQRDEGMYS